MTEPSGDNFNALIRGAYGSSRSKSARPIFHDQANTTPEDVRYAALRANKSQAEAERLARRQAARIGDGATFNVMLRNDHAAAKNRRKF